MSDSISNTYTQTPTPAQQNVDPASSGVNPASTDSASQPTGTNVPGTDMGSSADRIPSDTLDKNAFLMLLMTQLQNQNPLEPMDNSEMVSQLAQFTAIEELQNISLAMYQSEAYSMIGHYVQGASVDPTTGEQVFATGIVTGVTTEAGEVYLILDNNYQIRLDDVQDVLPDVNSINLATISTAVNTTQTIDLVGQNVQAILYKEGTVDGDGDGEMDPIPTTFVEGTVDHIEFTKDGTFLIVNGVKIEPSNITHVETEYRVIGRSIGYPDTQGAANTYISSTIKDVKFTSNGDAYFVLDDGQTRTFKIDDLDEISACMDLVGRSVDMGSGVQLITDAVITSEGVPMLLLDDGSMYTYEVVVKGLV